MCLMVEYASTCSYRIIINREVIEQALSHSEIALNVAIGMGSPFPQGLNSILAAQLHYELGHLEHAQQLLSDAYQVAKTMNSPGLKF